MQWLVSLFNQCRQALSGVLSSAANTVSDGSLKLRITLISLLGILIALVLLGWYWSQEPKSFAIKSAVATETPLSRTIT